MRNFLRKHGKTWLALVLALLFIWAGFGQSATHATGGPNQPIIWKLKTDNIKVSLEYDISMMGISMTGVSSTQMSLECEFDNLRQSHNEQATSEINTKGDAVIGKQDAGEAHSDAGSTPATVDYMRMSRNIKTDLPRLDVCDDTSTGQPENSCFIDAQATAPMTIEVRIDLPLPGAGEQTPHTANIPMVVKFDFPYDPWSGQPQENDVNLDEFIKEAIKTAPFPGKIKSATGSLHYRLELKPLKLQYGPGTSSILPYTGYKEKELTPNLSYNPAAKTKAEESFHLHANFKGDLQVDGQSQITYTPGGVQSPFKIWRLVRQWNVGYGDDGSIEQYTLNSIDSTPNNSPSNPSDKPGVDNSKNLKNKWVYDVVNGVTDWVDPPGMFKKRPSSWKTEGILDEFLVSVQDYPEFGFIYTFVIIETKPNAFRVRMFQGVPLDLKGAQEIYNSKAPFMTENYPGVTLVGEGDWVKVNDPKDLPVK